MIDDDFSETMDAMEHDLAKTMGLPIEMLRGRADNMSEADRLAWAASLRWMCVLFGEVGESLADFAHRLAAAAPAQGTFNGVLLRATGQSAAEIEGAYKAAWERRRRKRWLSVHGRGGNAHDRRKAWRKEARQ